MDSRPLLQKEKKLGILIDSKSVDSLISLGNKDAEILLKYATSEPFEFVRSPFDTSRNELKEIPIFTKKYDDKGNLSEIEIVRDEFHSRETCFGYRMQDIEEIGKLIYNKDSINSNEKEAMLLVFIHAALSIPDKINILVTDNKILLKNRLWFESHFPGFPLNIVTVEEAKEILNLFSKYQNKFYISGNYRCNKGSWYLRSFRSNIPNFHFGEPILDAFSTRFIYLLMSVDEIGFQYYLGIHNDTMDSTVYHFNYFISLVTGIFDSLAIKTKNQYKLKFKGERHPHRTSLNPRIGREFLRAVRGKNPDLRNHINKDVNFIKLIYQLREMVIHKEMLQTTPIIFIENGKKKWEINFIKINQEIVNFIHSFRDKNQKYDPITQWGVFGEPPNYFLEPFHFAKSATITLIKFSNKYLELLGFKNFIRKAKKKNTNGKFVRDIELFKRDNLGL